MPVAAVTEAGTVLAPIQSSRIAWTRERDCPITSRITSSTMHPLNVHENHIFFIGSAMAQSKTNDLEVYQPRNPKVSAYYRCVENHFEELEQNWDDKYAFRYGFWCRYIMTIFFKYLDCGDLHFGFA